MTELPSVGTDHLAVQLADRLGLAGGLRAAMLAVPRERFVPGVALACPPGAVPQRIDRAADPEAWTRAVFGDDPIVTQVREGEADLLDASAATSSLAAPGIAFRLLKLLAPRPGDRVLEVGTGTGYTAAVLSAWVGERNVTSVEAGGEVAARAAVNLKNAGFAPRLAVGDGTRPVGDGLYDRVHATCAVTQIPYSWVEQTRPGGTIVAVWRPSPGHEQIVVFHVGDQTAYGRFYGPADCMTTHPQHAEAAFRAHHRDAATVTATLLDPRTVHAALEGGGFEAMALGKAPGLGWRSEVRPGGAFSLLLFDAGDPDGSWAACDHEPGADRYEVLQYGPRCLWDAVQDAYLGWLNLGSPGLDRFGLAVNRAGTHVWFDDPWNTVRLTCPTRVTRTTPPTPNERCGR